MNEESEYDHLRIDRESQEKPSSVRGVLYWWLESDQNENRYIFDVFISSVIILSIVLLIMDTSYGPAENTPNIIPVANLVCLIIFIFEYLCRFWINSDFLADVLEASTYSEGLKNALKNKFKWMLEPFSIIDLIAIIPVGSLRALRMFRFFRIARLLRLVKLGRYSAGFSGFIEEIKNRSFELIALGAIAGLIILIGATAIFTVEGPYTGKSQFKSFGDAIWWATVTTTTVGYGDIFPQYTPGRIVAAVLMLSSIGIVSALGGILTSAIMERVRKMREGRVERLNFENHIVFCGWTPSARKVADTLYQTDILDDHQLVVITEGDVPDRNYLVTLSGDYTRPRNLKTVSAGDARFVVVFYQSSDEKGHDLADRRSVLTALQAEKLNPHGEDPHTITEVYSEKSANLVTGKDIEGEETLDKEEFDANLILNTIKYPGHTTKMFYNLSDINNQWIQLYDPHEFVESHSLPISVKNFKRKLAENNYRKTFLGILNEDGRHFLNPDNSRKIEQNTSIYLIDQSPYQKDYQIQQEGLMSYDFSVGDESLSEIQSDFVFMGFNLCAQQVIQKLEKSSWSENDQKIIVISETTPPDKPYLKHIQKDYINFEELNHDTWWDDKKLAIIFHENTNESEIDSHEVDIKTATTTLKMPEGIRIIAEIVEEDYAEVLQRDISKDIELIYKERFDANIIANSILNKGKMTEVFMEMGDEEGTHLKTFSLSDLTTNTEITVKDFKLNMLDHNKMIFLGMMKPGDFKPILNPDPETKVEENDIIYFLFSNS